MFLFLASLLLIISLFCFSRFLFFLLFFLCCMSFCSCYFSYPLVFPSLVFLFVTHPYFIFTFPFVLCVFLFCVFFLVPPLSHFSCFFSLQVPVCAWKGQPWKEQLSHLFAFRGSLRKCRLRKIMFYDFLVDFFCPHNMFLLDILGTCFEGTRDPLLPLICCYIVLLVFGEAFFCPTCLLCQHFLDSFCFVFVFFLGGGWLLFLWSFAEACFCVSFIFLILGCCFFAAVWSCWFLTFMSWRRVFACGFGPFGYFHFVVTLLGGRSGRANREGSIYSGGFFIIGVFGRKQALPSGRRVFANGFGFETGHVRGKKCFNFLSRETL